MTADLAFSEMFSEGLFARVTFLFASATGTQTLITLVIFWGCEVVEKVVEKVWHLGLPRNSRKAHKNAGLPQMPRINTYISLG
jgi:hypothetical protein